MHHPQFMSVLKLTRLLQLLDKLGRLIVSQKLLWAAGTAGALEGGSESAIMCRANSPRGMGALICCGTIHGASRVLGRGVRAKWHKDWRAPSAQSARQKREGTRRRAAQLTLSSLATRHWLDRRCT